MNRIIAPILAVSIAAVGAAIGFCAVAAPLTGFVYQSKNDLFGYYVPAQDYPAGKYLLAHITLGDRDEFAAFLHGKRMAQFAPVMITFENRASKQINGELGPYYQDMPRVLPMAFQVSGNDVKFDGTEKHIGHVTFTGKLDMPALKGAKGQGDSNAIVLRGDLTLNGNTFKNATFRWFGGD